jgi:hypothetical protein
MSATVTSTARRRVQDLYSNLQRQLTSDVNRCIWYALQKDVSDYYNKHSFMRLHCHSENVENPASRGKEKRRIHR